MDLYEEDEIAPSIAIGRLSLLSILVYFVPGYFVLSNNGVSKLFVNALIPLVIIYILLALRQKIIFYDEYLHIKRIARQPFKIPYREITKVAIVKIKKQPNIVIYGGESGIENLIQLPLSLESKRRIEKLAQLFSDKNIEVAL